MCIGRTVGSGARPVPAATMRDSIGPGGKHVKRAKQYAAAVGCSCGLSGTCYAQEVAEIAEHLSNGFTVESPRT
jgi:hypothetical protein